jgi:type I restriction enzyme R subunit
VAVAVSWARSRKRRLVGSWFRCRLATWTVQQPPSNFAFLAPYDESLARLGALAEWAFNYDPPTTLTKLRQYAEMLAKIVAARHGLDILPRENFETVLRLLRDDGVLPRQPADLFHHLRRAGNTAVHDNLGTPAEALGALKQARQLGIWFVRAYGKAARFEPGPFRPPEPPQNATATLHAEVSRLRHALAEQQSRAEAEAQARKAEARARETAEQKAAREAGERAVWEALAAEQEAANVALGVQLRHLCEQAEATAPSARAALLQQSERAAEAIELDEADTRLIVDAKLRAMGWKADTNRLRHALGRRPDPSGAVAIAEWPTESGPVDYALFVKGRCVGVIEAKKLGTDVPSVLEQTKRYASGIRLAADEALAASPWRHGPEAAYRVPFVFATNGRPFVKQLATKSGIWFWDARRATNTAAALPEWFSPNDIEEKLAQDLDADRHGLAGEPFDYTGLRPYQRQAVEAIEAAVADGRRDLLVAMATGTGKTRTCVALMYRLLKHKRFRRILFLVDRDALGDQAEKALDNTELEGLLKFSATFNVAKLAKKIPEKEDRVQVATVQSLVRRILYPADEDDRPSPGLYDCIIVDEAHRGYLLDAELREEDLNFRTLDEYLSRYRRVLDYFDAVKIGLTATPALHTTQIFGPPVFSYGYRQAVVDGFLIDHLPPRRITTALAQAGISFEPGEEVQLIDPRTGQIDLFTAPDQIDFEVQEFNKRVYTREFNRVVAEALASEIPPDAPGKTLIFAARDGHADMLVAALRTALETEYGPQPHDLVQKITGHPSVDRPTEKIRIFRNDPRPKYVVTVDLLTTGVDIPEICNLVFVRRVNSRILYDQMIGRATRLAPHIGKEFFRIFDAVDIYANLQSLTDMRPVVSDPDIPLATLIADLARAPTDADRGFVRDQIVVRLRRMIRHLTEAQRADFEPAAGMSPEAFLEEIRTAAPDAVSGFLDRHSRAVAILESARPAPRRDGVFISEHPDELVSVTDVFDGALGPEDYISAFETYIRANSNTVPGLIAAVQKPRELTRKELRELATLLDTRGFSEAKLRRAYGQARNADIAAHIIGFIRQAALGDPLMPYEARVENALRNIGASRNWTPKQLQWLRRLGRALKEHPIGDRAILEEPAFVRQGGFEAIDREFGNNLETVLQDFNEAIWGSPAA